MPDTQVKTDELMELGRRSKRLAFDFRVDTSPGYTQVSLDLRTKGLTWDLRWKADRFVPPSQHEGIWLPPPATTVSGVLAGLGKELAGASVDLSSLSVKSTGSPIKGAALKELVVAALKEHFATAGASAASENQHAATVAVLRRGDVQAWNGLSEVDRQTAGPFRGLSLSGLKLDGIQLTGYLRHLDFEGTDFSRSSLVRAGLQHARVNGCSFEDADLSEVLGIFATFHSANLQSAKLVGARVTRATFRNANLQGADLTGAEVLGTNFSSADLRRATLVGLQTGDYQGVPTRFDERTQFPDGFEPGDGWRRAEGGSADG